MANRRMLSVSISVSEQVADLRDDFTRLLFTWMIPHADDYGVLPGAPRRVRALVVPLIDCATEQVEAALADIEARELIWRYTDGEGRAWLQFRKWEEHQQGLHKRTAPKSPLYSEVVGYTKEIPTTSRKFPEVPSEQKRIEGNRREENIAASAKANTKREVVKVITPETADAVPATPTPTTTTKKLDPIWDALVEELGYSPVTKPERSDLGGCVKELKAIGATPDEIHRRCALYRLRYPGMDLTARALLKYWSLLATPIPANSSNGHQRSTPPLSPMRPDGRQIDITAKAPAVLVTAPKQPA